MEPVLGGPGPPPVLAEQDVHGDRGRLRARRTPTVVGRPDRRPLPGVRRPGRSGEPGHPHPRRPVDGHRSPPGHGGPGGLRRPARTGARVPAARAGIRSGHLVHLQPTRGLRGGGGPAAGGRLHADRVPAATALPSPRHRPGRLARAPGGSIGRLQRVARHHGGRRQTGAALPARGALAGPSTVARRLGRRHASAALRAPGPLPRLADRTRLPGLVQPARLPRGRGVRTPSW